MSGEVIDYLEAKKRLRGHLNAKESVSMETITTSYTIQGETNKIEIVYTGPKKEWNPFEDMKES